MAGSLKLRARKIPIDRGGYDRQGRYYGSGDPVFEVTAPEDADYYDPEMGRRVELHGIARSIVRARTKDAAIRQVRTEVLRFLAKQRRKTSHNRYSRYIHGGSYQNPAFDEADREARDAFQRQGWRGQAAVMRAHALRKRRKKATQTRRRR